MTGGEDFHNAMIMCVLQKWGGKNRCCSKEGRRNQFRGKLILGSQGGRFLLGLFCLAGPCGTVLMAQSSLTFDAHTHTSYHLAESEDLHQLTQVDMARMLPVQKSIRESRHLDTNGMFSISKEVLAVSGNQFMAHEVGQTTHSDAFGVITRNADGDTLLHLPYDGDYWHPDTIAPPFAIESLFTDPFAGLDSMIGTMPPGMITQGPGYVKVLWPNGDETTYYPEYLIVKHEILMADSTWLRHGIRYQVLDGDIMVPLKEVKETSLLSEYGLCITEKVVTDYDGYIVNPGNSGGIRESSVGFRSGDLHLFPNPVHDLLQVTAHWAEGPSQITVFSIDGRQVLAQTSRADKDRYVLQVGHLPPGTYYLRIADASGHIRTASFVRF